MKRKQLADGYQMIFKVIDNYFKEMSHGKLNRRNINFTQFLIG